MSDPFVHPTAVVDEGAEVGEGTKIWHFSHVMSGAMIGLDCSLGQNVFVASGVTIGDGVQDPEQRLDLRRRDARGLVFCGPSMVFTNVRNPRAAYPTTSDRLRRHARAARRDDRGQRDDRLRHHGGGVGVRRRRRPW